MWRVNAEMFHAHIRAHFIGRLVHERFGDKVQSAGHIIAAALKCTAHRQHSPCVRDTTLNTTSTSSTNTADTSIPFPFISKQQRRSRMISGEGSAFCPDDIVEYMSPQMVSMFQSKPGGVATAAVYGFSVIESLFQSIYIDGGRKCTRSFKGRKV